jgi:hypothetical protein
MNIYIVDYSEKAIALFGDTTDYKTHISNAGGKYNPSLRYNEQRQAGWIFPKTKKAEVEKLVNQIKSGSIEEVKQSVSSTPVREYKKKTETNDCEWVSKQDFMNLVSKVERLEQEYNRLLQLKNKEELKELKERKEPKVEKESEYESEEEESEEEEKPKRLLRKK